MMSPINSTTPGPIRPPNQLIFAIIRRPNEPHELTRTTETKSSEGISFEDFKQFVQMEMERWPMDADLDTLYETLQPDPSTVDHHCKIVTNDLYCILSPLGPNQIDLFGSTVMGVSFQGSDLDFHITVTEKTDEISRLLHRVRRYLADSKKFRDFEVICDARVPIVKCLHIESGLRCDINFTSSIGVYNSRIMAHLFRLDARVHKVALVIKFWMKCHNLIAAKSLTSYATLWLVIFYLQQLETPLLPPIDVFQKDVSNFSIETANLSFNFQLPNPMTQNVDHISTLLHGFFEFYAKFDFETQFISPLHGRAFPRNSFESLFPHHFVRYRETLKLNPTAEPLRFGKPICIQDPFDICRSIPGTLCGMYYPKFRVALTNAAQICQDNLMTTGGSRELLLALFNSELILPKDSASYFIGMDNGKRNMNVTITATAEEIDSITNYFQRYLPTASPSNKEIKQLWAELCMSFLRDMFKDIFGCQLENEKISDSYSSATFDIIGTKNVFSKRKPMKLPLPSLEAEMKRTKKKLKKGRSFYDIPLRISCRTWTDLGNDFVFLDCIDHDKNSRIDQFYAAIQKRARQLIYAYFAYEIFDIQQNPSTSNEEMSCGDENRFLFISRTKNKFLRKKS